MAVRTSYTETQLAEYLWLELGNYATVLGWLNGGHAQIWQAVQDTARLLGVSTVGAATDAARVERLGAVAVWRRARRGVGALYDIQLENGQRYSRSQLLKALDGEVARAEAAAMADLPEYSIRRDVLVRPSGDPYQWYPDEWRTVPGVSAP